MSTHRTVNSLLTLLRRRYPAWQDFSHAPFVADEIAYKQNTIQKAAQLLSQKDVDQLLAAGDFDEMVHRIDLIARDNNLLWRNVPSAGDTAVLHHPDLDKPTFCTHMRNLLYGDRPTSERLQTFSDYLLQQQLPNKWPFPTYFLFVCRPDSEMFVKPRTAEWLLKFLGTPHKMSGGPNGQTYALFMRQINTLREDLLPYGVRDHVDVQSLVWVCAQEGKRRTGRLNTKGQIALDVPPSTPPQGTHYEITAVSTHIHEPTPGELERDTAGPHPVYTLEQCSRETGLPLALLDRWKRAITRKGQAIFYGPPGTGKTFIAQKLAQHLLSNGDGELSLVQFHPAYSYEEFMQGIRPINRPDDQLHFDLVPGRFLQFCAQAQQRSGLSVLIIDEINRANLPSVFGELMYLLEYRDAAIPLAGGGTFSIPANVRIIATMNTADRSIALVDHALRRRFAFLKCAPNTAVLQHYHTNTPFDPTGLITLIKQLNNAIANPHYEVGHTFFLHADLTTQLPDIWQMEIEPYLEEYFFDQPAQVDAFRWSKIKAQVMG